MAQIQEIARSVATADGSGRAASDATALFLMSKLVAGYDDLKNLRVVESSERRTER